ncbi:MAG: hypothetical protein RR840_06400 [Clostridium sp.]
MNKYIKSSLILIAALVTTLIIFIYNAPPKEEATFPEDLKTKELIQKTIEKNTIINFTSTLNFKFDNMIIIKPYTDLDNYLKTTDIIPKKLNTNIHTADDIHLILFIKDQEIISYINYPRNSGDFPMVNNTIYPYNQTDFTITKKKNWIFLDPVK